MDRLLKDGEGLWLVEPTAHRGDFTIHVHSITRPLIISACVSGSGISLLAFQHLHGQAFEEAVITDR